MPLHQKETVGEIPRASASGGPGGHPDREEGPEINRTVMYHQQASFRSHTDWWTQRGADYATIPCGWHKRAVGGMDTLQRLV